MVTNRGKIGLGVIVVLLAALGFLAWQWKTQPFASQTVAFSSGPDVVPSDASDAGAEEEIGPVNFAPVSFVPVVTAADQSRLSAASPAPSNPTPVYAGLPPETVWRVPANADGVDYIVALDELYLPARSDLPGNTLRLTSPAADLPVLLRIASEHAPADAALSAAQPNLVLYPADSPRSESQRLLVTMQVWIETDLPSSASTSTSPAPAALSARAAELGLVRLQPVTYSPGTYIADVAGDPAQPLRAAAALSQMPGVRLAMPVLAPRLAPAAIPNDPLFSRQWHLYNNGQQGGKAGCDINVLSVWDQGYSGADSGSGLEPATPVRIGIVDDGIQMSITDVADWPYPPESDHPDLKQNLGGKHKDWLAPIEASLRAANPHYQFIEAGKHGTPVAGLAAARGNNTLGLTGVAPRSSLTRLRVLGHEKSTPALIAEALVWDCPAADMIEQNGVKYPPLDDVIHVKNNSWGPYTTKPSEWPAWTTYKPIFDALATGVRQGRYWAGTIYVFASGNDQLINPGVKNPVAAGSINLIPVGAADNKGKVASYSQGGPHLVVSAPCDAGTGVATTDLTGDRGYNALASKVTGEVADLDYTTGFTGTSAAASIVSGVVALMLEANPDLGWRDVKEILLRTSTRTGGSNWVTRDGGQPSLPLIKHDDRMGGGIVNATEAVKLARAWQNLPVNLSTEPANDPVYGSSSLATTAATTLPDKGSAKAIFDFSQTGSNIRVEHVELELKVTHSQRGALTITLRSPSGVTSTFLPRHGQDTGANVQTTLVSVRHWGELSKGKWTLTVTDAVTDERIGILATGTKLTLTGALLTEPLIKAPDQPVPLTIVPVGSSATLITTGTGHTLHYQWRQNNQNIPVATTPTANDPALVIPSATISHGGSYTCRVSNLLGATVSAAANLTVYETTAQSMTASAGSTLVFPTLVSGTGLQNLAWYRDGKPLLNDNRISGANTTRLTIKNLTTADSGAYTLQVNAADGTSLNGGAHILAPVNLTVTPRPGDENAIAITGEVGRGLALSVPEGGVSYSYKGLPKGLKYDKKTGLITHYATTPGSYPVTLTITWPDKTKTTLPTWLVTIEPSPAVGTFNGFVHRSPSLNQNLGASFTLTSTPAGSFTGKLTIAKSSASFRGNLSRPETGPAILATTVTPRGYPPLALYLEIPQDGTAATGYLQPVGSPADVASVTASLANGTAAAVTAWRNPWNKKTFPATSQTGAYTLAMENPVSNPALQPAGYTTAALKVADDGKLTWTLYPADGSSALKGSTTISFDGTFPLYAVESTPAGTFLGWITLPDRFSTGSITTGDLTWTRAPVTSSKGVQSYPDGFGPLPLTLTGAAYAPPAKGALLFGLVPEDGNLQLKLVENEATGMGEQGYYLDALYFGLWTGNKIRNPTMPLTPKLTLKPATGEFSGSLTLADPNPANPNKTIKRTVKFNGVILQNWDQAVGYYLLPVSPAGTMPGPLSGEAILMPKVE